MNDKRARILEDDFCDLEPGKICDNCCRCIDNPEVEYNGILADFDVLSDEYVLDEINVLNEPMERPDIDPKLLAEWEEKLCAYEAEIAARMQKEDTADRGAGLLDVDFDLDEE